MTEPSDFGPAHLKAVATETTVRKTQRLVRVRTADGATVYITETMQAGMLRARVVHFLERWRDQNKITVGMFNAAQEYERAFYTAACGPRYATSSLVRVDKGNASLEVALLEAERRAQQARVFIAACDGAAGLIGATALVYIVGHGDSLANYARRMGSSRYKAAIILVRALGCLEEHLRYASH